MRDLTVPASVPVPMLNKRIVILKKFMPRKSNADLEKQLSLQKIFSKVFLFALLISLLYFALGYWRFFESNIWNLPGFAMLLAADPWSSLWLGHSVLVGKLIGFELRNALTTVIMPISFAFNVASAVTFLAWIWRITRHSERMPKIPGN